MIDNKGQALERNLNRALFDAQMLVFSVADVAAVPLNKAKILREVAALFEDADFLDTIRRATGDRSRTFERVRSVGRAVVRAGVAVDLAKLGKL